MPEALRLHLLDNRYPALHGARVLAIVCVLQVHVSNLLIWRFGVRDNPFFALSRQGWLGLDFLFVLSGFLIGTMLFHSEADRSLGSIARFYARRGFRIFPLYYLTLAALTFAPFTDPRARANVLYEFAYLSNYVIDHKPLVMIWDWSLCVEEHFYLAVPLLMLPLRLVKTDRARLALLVALWVVAGLVRVGTYLHDPAYYTPDRLFLQVYVRTHHRGDVLVCGILLAFVNQRYRAWLEAALARRGVRRALWALVAFCLWLVALPVPPIADRGLWSVLSWGTLSSVLCGAVITLCIAGDDAARRALAAPVFLPLATMGYATYLVHIPVCEHLVLPVTTRLGLSLGATWLVSLAGLCVVAGAIAYPMHLIVDKRVLALRDRWFPAGRQRVAAG